jgi:hypothetical protein
MLFITSSGRELYTAHFLKGINYWISGGKKTSVFITHRPLLRELLNDLPSSEKKRTQREEMKQRTPKREIKITNYF